MYRYKLLSWLAPLILGIYCFLFHSAVNGQSNSPYTPQIIPPSPNAASLGKFGDIPISPYTGTTDISVPVYTIQAKGISVPVSLSYHTGGIRLAEEAGWVGLGWALNAGGMISRSINDKDDFGGGYFNADLVVPVPEVKGKLLNRIPYIGETSAGVWGYFFTCRYNVLTEVNTYNSYNSWLNVSSAPATYDMEPDSYSFNFLGRSGKFIIGRDRKVVLQKQENLKIQFATDASSFTITDEQGNNYYFQDKEYSLPTTGGAQHVSSWLLSKVITQAKDSVMFNYITDNTWTNVKGISHESDRKGMAGYEGTTYANDPGQTYYNKTLQTIDYTNAQLQFSFDGNRSDLHNGKKLNGIKIYSKDQTGLRYQREQQLFYSYFGTGLGDTLEFQRLRLDSVREASGSNTLPPYVFSYNTPSNMSGFTGKHYSSVDHWGYFNGKSNAVFGNYALGFIPPFLGIVGVGGTNSSVLLDLPGANREPDPSYMNAFSINKVSYPTGGYTMLDYEPNYYDYYNSISGSGGKDFEYITTVDKTAQFIINTNGTTSGTIDFSNIFYTCLLDMNHQPIGTNGILSIAFQAVSSDSLNKYHNALGYGKINFTFQNNVTDISNSSLYCNGTVTNGNCSGTVYSAGFPISILSKSVFPWSAYIDPIVKVSGGLQNIVATFTWKEALFTNSTMLMGGGLRVKAITDYDINGSIAKKRTYQYDYTQDRNGDGIPETYSFGRLMGYLSYGRYEILDISSNTHGRSFTRYGSSNSSFTSQSSGNIVGYDQVTEFTIDPQTGVDNGKTVYSYNNSSDTTYTFAGYKFPGLSNLCNNLNGLPSSKSVYAKSGNNYRRISSVDYYYRSANRIIYDAFKYQHFQNMPPNAVSAIPCIGGNSACNCPLQIDSTGYYLLANYYPAISSEVVLLDSALEKTFDQNDTTIQVKTTHRNYYDNPVHYQLTRASSIDSKGNSTVSLVKYPQDYIPNGNTITSNTILDSMINKNMVSETIEKRDSLYYFGSGTGYVKKAQLSRYKLLTGNVIALDKQYNLDIPSPVTDFSGFSISGNTTNQDNRYRQMISMDSYNSSSDIQQYTQTDQLPMSVLWDYKKMYPIAQAKKAFITDIAYTSFEADSSGRWAIPDTSRDRSFYVTGSQCYDITNTKNITASVSTGQQYIVSYWAKSSSVIVKSNGATVATSLTGLTKNGWTYYECLLPNTTTSVTVTASTSTQLDELRLYPANAQMTTYTYIPILGISSACDADNRVNYYEYDVFGRLKWIKDQDGNFIKTFRYHYGLQPASQ